MLKKCREINAGDLTSRHLGVRFLCYLFPQEFGNREHVLCMLQASREQRREKHCRDEVRRERCGRDRERGGARGGGAYGDFCRARVNT